MGDDKTLKILFIENKYKTNLWRVIGDNLELKGFDVFYIIQNHIFNPKRKNCYYIPYPNSSRDGNMLLAENFLPLEKLQEIGMTDRNINYFGCKSINHYYYYYRKIKELIEKLEPDVIFGESTLFHELITIQIAKELGILYLNPSSIRYPVGRFAFFEYDTLSLYGCSGEKWTNKQIEKTIESIRNRAIKPDYMRVLKKNYIRQIENFFICYWSYKKGEKYNTPSVSKKAWLEYNKRKIAKTWDMLSEKRMRLLSDTQKFNIFFPLQLQPEANLDVYGMKWRNQLDTLKLLLNNTNSSTRIVIKPNPKFKYEVNDEFIEFMESNERVIPLPLTMTINEALKNINLIVTVTGTISIEAALSDIPVITLIEWLPNRLHGCVYLDDISSIQLYCDMVINGSFPKSSEEDKFNFIKEIIGQSYQGIIFDPLFTPCRSNDINITNILNAFYCILHQIKNNTMDGKKEETLSCY